MPLRILEEKLALLHARDVLTYPGGTLLEAAIVQQHCRFFMKRAKELGFGAVEISEGTIDLPGDRRRRVIDCARDAGLVAITEVGRKDPKRQPSAAELAEQVLKDLTWGASFVIIEGRECGQGIGIYDGKGEIRTSVLDEILRLVGDAAPRLIWEAPLQPQQAYLVCRFGANVSLGNIVPQECLALEALRCGLRFETFSAIANQSLDEGRWDPARVEEAPPIGLTGETDEPCNPAAPHLSCHRPRGWRAADGGAVGTPHGHRVWPGTASPAGPGPGNRLGRSCTYDDPCRARRHPA